MPVPDRCRGDPVSRGYTPAAMPSARPGCGCRSQKCYCGCPGSANFYLLVAYINEMDVGVSTAAMKARWFRCVQRTYRMSPSPKTTGGAQIILRHFGMFHRGKLEMRTSQGLAVSPDSFAVCGRCGNLTAIIVMCENQ